MALGAAAPLMLHGLTPQHIEPKLEKIKPKRLQAGDLIGLITPGSFIPDAALEKAVKNLETLGFRTALAPNIRAKMGYVAGTDQQRLDDLHGMFANPEIKAVWCARGGYGCTRLLPRINFNLIRQNPKVFIGYSDITALLNAVWQKTGLVGFHGPVASSTFTPYTIEHLLAVLVEAQSPHEIPLAIDYADSTDPLFQYQTLQPGKVQGTLAGGNLTLLSAMAGTEFAFNATGKLVFMEDIDEKPYRVDRMLTQLQQSAHLDKALGFALGIFSGCTADAGDESLTLSETVSQQLVGSGAPAVYGLSFGHVQHQCTLPVGIQAQLDTQAKTITLLERAVL
jgi:muramoyltetrapeptide carboxypeptidase